MSSPFPTEAPAEPRADLAGAKVLSRDGVGAAGGLSPEARKSKLARGGLAVLGGQWINVLLTLGSTMVLARLLEPADFGLLGMVFALTSFINSFRDFGLPMAALQSGQLTHLQSSALFWTNLPISLGVTAFMILMGPVLAWFYGEPRLVLLTAVMSSAVLCSTLANQHESMMTRQLRFAAMVKWDILFLGLGAGSAIFLALAGAGYWALAAQLIVWQIGRAAAVWFVSGWRPAGWKASAQARREVRHLLSFGAYLTGFRIISALREVDRVLIGKISGAHALGLYEAAFKWSRLPLRQIYTPLLGPAVAGLSHVRDDPPAYVRNARAIMVPVVGASVPVLVYAAFFAEPLILLLLGRKWEGAITIFRWLCVGAVAQACMKMTKWFYVSTGRTRQQFYWGLVSTPVLVAAIVTGVLWDGARGVAVAYTLAVWALLLPGLAYCLHRAPLSLWTYLAVLSRPLVSAIVAGAAALMLVAQTGMERPVTQVLLSAPAFGVIYLVLWLAIPGGRAAAAETIGLLRALRSTKPQAIPAAASEESHAED